MEATRNTMKEIERTIGGLYNSTLVTGHPVIETAGTKFR